MRDASPLVLVLGLVIGTELIAAPLLFALAILFGHGLLRNPLWLAAILLVSTALATGILHRGFAKGLQSDC